MMMKRHRTDVQGTMLDDANGRKRHDVKGQGQRLPPQDHQGQKPRRLHLSRSFQNPCKRGKGKAGSAQPATGKGPEPGRPVSDPGTVRSFPSGQGGWVNYPTFNMPVGMQGSPTMMNPMIGSQTSMSGSGSWLE